MNDLKTAQEFADELLGSEDDQLYRYYEGQIAWRQRLVEQYHMELKLLEERRNEVTRRMMQREALREEQEADPLSGTDPDLGKKLAALPGGATGLVDDPNATQAMAVPSVDDE